MNDLTTEISRRSALATVLVAGLAPYAVRSQGQYPSQPIRIVVPFPAGGQTDVASRILAQGLSERLKNPVIVDNRPGAGGTVGAAAVASAKGDGYTLLFGNTASVSIAPYLYPKARYDPQRDFRAISLTTITPQVVVVPSASPYQTLQQLVAAMRSKPGALNAGSPGSGTPGHLALQWLQKTAGGTATHIPFTGGAPMMAALVGGQIDFAVEGITTVLPMEGKNVRTLAVTGSSRASKMPNVPTLKEVLKAEAELSGWTGLLAPASTPDNVASVLSEACHAVMKSPEMDAFLSRSSLVTEDWSPAEFSAFLRRSARQWSVLAAGTGLKLE